MSVGVEEGKYEEGKYDVPHDTSVVQLKYRRNLFSVIR